MTAWPNFANKPLQNCLLDHLVHYGDQARRHSEAECLHSLHIDDKFKLGCLQNRQVGGLVALENTAGVEAGLPVSIGPAGSVTHQTASCDELAGLINRRHSLSRCQAYDLFRPAIE